MMDILIAVARADLIISAALAVISMIVRLSLCVAVGVLINRVLGWGK